MDMTSLNKYVIKMDSQCSETFKMIKSLKGIVEEEPAPATLQIPSPQTQVTVRQSFSTWQWFLIKMSNNISGFTKYIIRIAILLAVSFGISYIITSRNNPDAPAGELMEKTFQSFSVLWSWIPPLFGS